MIFFKKLSYKISKFFSKFRFLNLNWGSLAVSAVVILIIIILGTNIYNTYVNGMNTINEFQQEQKKLEDLKALNDDLQKQVDHYSSLEYKKIYARENLNLADSNESLYYIDRPDEELQIEGLPTKQQEITFQDNISYWRKLILGI